VILRRWDCPVTFRAVWLSSNGEVSNEDVLANIQTVRDFVNTAFKERRPKEAFDLYTDGRYIQHDPTVPDGEAGFLQHAMDTLGSHPNWDFEVKRIIAQDDYVVLHVSTTLSGKGPEFAVMDIWRLEDGKIAEHWAYSRRSPTTPRMTTRCSEPQSSRRSAADGSALTLSHSSLHTASSSTRERRPGRFPRGMPCPRLDATFTMR
jgi:predicted SnoaL-like aldol condensation-catalyzing enzyme